MLMFGQASSRAEVPADWAGVHKHQVQRGAGRAGRGPHEDAALHVLAQSCPLPDLRQGPAPAPVP